MALAVYASSDFQLKKSYIKKTKQSSFLNFNKKTTFTTFLLHFTGTVFNT